MSDLFPSNDDILRFGDGELAGYVDSGVWELEDWLARRDRVRLHLRLTLDDAVED